MKIDLSPFLESTDSAKKAVEQLHADGKLVQMAKVGYDRVIL